jgi:hypothetical protein
VEKQGFTHKTKPIIKEATTVFLIIVLLPLKPEFGYSMFFYVGHFILTGIARVFRELSILLNKDHNR